MNDQNAMTIYHTFDDRDNPANRCPVVLLLDTSYSMSGQPIAELNRGVADFVAEVRHDEVARFSVELACVSFGGHPVVKLPFTNISAIEPEGAADFYADGGTPMGVAVEMGLDLLDKRKRNLKRMGIPYYQPWMVLMTDGAPTDDTVQAAERIHRLAAERRLIFLGIGIGEYADMDMLAELCPDNRPPKRLAGLEFGAFFEWLSQSVGAVSRSQPGDKVNLPSTDGWECV